MQLLCSSRYVVVLCIIKAMNMEAKPFPTINVTEGRNPETFAPLGYYLIGLSEVDDILHGMSMHTQRVFDDTGSADSVLKIWKEESEPAYRLLLTAVSFCVRCPVQKSGVCSGFEEVKIPGERPMAVLRVSEKARGDRDLLAEEVKGNKCGLTVEQLI